MTARPPDRRDWYDVAAANPLLALVGLGLALVWLMLLVYTLEHVGGLFQSGPPIENATDERNRTQSIALGVATLAGLAAPLVIGVRLYVTWRQTQASERQAETAIQSQITERFTKAVEQLGSDKTAVRLGAILALERIAIDSERDRMHILETLNAFVLHESVQAGSEDDPDLKPPRIDIQAALSALTRRSW